MAFGDDVGARHRELLQTELAHRLQQPVAATAGAVLHDHHGLLDETAEGLDRREGVEGLEAADDPDRSQIEPAAEHRQPGEEHPAVRVEQVVRPLDRRPQRPVALHPGPPTGGEEPETVVEQGRDVGRGEALHPRRGQLDRQRNAVEPPADLLDGEPVGLQLERRHDLTGPVRRTA